MLAYSLRVLMVKTRLTKYKTLTDTFRYGYITPYTAATSISELSQFLAENESKCMPALISAFHTIPLNESVPLIVNKEIGIMTFNGRNLLVTTPDKVRHKTKLIFSVNKGVKASTNLVAKTSRNLYYFPTGEKFPSTRYMIGITSFVGAFKDFISTIYSLLNYSVSANTPINIGAWLSNAGTIHTYV